VERLLDWSGVVLAVGKDAFLARLTDALGEGPEHEAEIWTAELGPADLQRLRVGSIFRWTISHLDWGGRRSRVSSIRIGAVGKWTEEDELEMKVELDELADFFRVDDGVD
jgi:hypothetical protein